MQLNRHNFAEFFRADFYTVKVIFAEDTRDSQNREVSGRKKQYTYKVPKNMEVNLGSKCFVCTYNNLDEVEALKVVTVISRNDTPEIEGASCYEYKWIVGKVDEVMEGYAANVAKDTKLKTAVAKLEQTLERVALRKQLAIALEEIDPETRAELTALFGTELQEYKKVEGGKDV